MTDQTLAVLQTVRDWLRFGVSRFSEARLVYGHGTTTALDEAAFLILTTLHLPHDDLTPWLDAKLTIAERKALADVIEARVVTRKPAPYLVKCAWMGPYKFYCDERVIVPRSFLGELLIGGLAGVIDPDAPPRRILDLCTGSGCLAVIAATQYPEADVHACDLSTDALAVARRNVDEHELADRITLHEGDLLGAVGGMRFDLILSNPPYVPTAAVGRFPQEYKAEPVMAHDGGSDGLTLVRRMLAEAHGHLTPQGRLVVEIGEARPAFEASYPDLPVLWLDTEDSEAEVFVVEAAALGGARPKRGGTKKR